MVKSIQIFQNLKRKSKIWNTNSSRHFWLWNTEPVIRNQNEKVNLGLMTLHTKGLLLPLQKVLQNCSSVLVFFFFYCNWLPRRCMINKNICVSIVLQTNWLSYSQSGWVCAFLDEHFSVASASQIPVATAVKNTRFLLTALSFFF